MLTAIKNKIAQKVIAREMALEVKHRKELLMMRKLLSCIDSSETLMQLDCCFIIFMNLKLMKVCRQELTLWELMESNLDMKERLIVHRNPHALIQRSLPRYVNKAKPLIDHR